MRNWQMAFFFCRNATQLYVNLLKNAYKSMKVEDAISISPIFLQISLESSLCTTAPNVLLLPTART